MCYGEEKSDNIQKCNISQAQRVHSACPRREVGGVALTFFGTPKVGEVGRDLPCWLCL